MIIFGGYSINLLGVFRRQTLGLSSPIWQGLTDVFMRAIPVLEAQSFSWKNPSTAGSYEQSSSNLIAFHYQTLVKDLERLNDLVIISRNLLATTKLVQDLAAEKGFDQQILALIDTCVKVTARGFDGDTNPRNEDRWQKVVQMYKRLLITCLQFLHNFIMHNEQRKLVLWLDLFGYRAPGEIEGLTSKEQFDLSTNPPRGLAPVIRTGERFVEPPEPSYDQTAEDLLMETLSNFPREPATIKEEAATLLLANIKEHMEKLLGRSLTEIQEMGKSPEQIKEIRTALTAILGAKMDAVEELKEKGHDPPPTPTESPELAKKQILTMDRSASAGCPRICWVDLPDFKEFAAISDPDATVTAQDMSMPRSAQSAAGTLKEAKHELFARLREADRKDGYDSMFYRRADDASVSDGDDNAEEGSIDEEEEDEEDDEEDEEDDYRGRPGDQQRGLLTDIPLVLGPAEIEALPMILLTGIVDSLIIKDFDGTPSSKNMQALRCHILLSQETGRNLLRELLIFIAAWDLPDDEFYFKMMVQIMENVLRNGLMSHAYSDFGQSKDIISPAQAVVVKILTHIFRSKYSPASVDASKPTTPKTPAKISRVDLLTVRYIFSIFRGNIIPETCALIYLQGRIRNKRARSDDFPLNLWDMERVYEGVYQFLEFFAVLTENNDWKNLLVKWEIVYELVTLIRQLEASIPKGGLEQSRPAPIAVERPYDPNNAEADDTRQVSDRSGGSSPELNDDPSEFEWRNLKKLVVLVLSSLVWKCPEVQNQIRKYDGVEAILACTSFDAHNPYIKEHAVMCLKFLLEGNPANQKLVEDLEAREVVKDSSGILETSGLQAVIDTAGKLAVRPQEGQVQEIEEGDKP